MAHRGPEHRRDLHGPLERWISLLKHDLSAQGPFAKTMLGFVTIVAFGYLNVS
jgi:hypothetical protein